MPSPPKPWEVNNSNSAATTTAPITQPSAAIDTTLSNPPIPDRSAINTMNRPGGYGTTGYGATGYGTTGYGGYGATAYGGGYGTGYGGGYGTTGYGGMTSRYGMGGYGSSYGMGGYGMGGYNRFGPGDPNGLTQRMEQGSRPAFELIQSIVGAFGGFAQMLDSTFMATHSSFMAMVGVAEQLGHLKSYLGQVFSLVALYSLIKKTYRRVTGQPGKITTADFELFERSAAASPTPSRKPLLFFLAMVVGLPYLMHKLIQRVSVSQQQQQQQQQQQEAIDPAALEFARATYDFTAESPMELGLKKGDIVAILSKTDAVTQAPSQWWKGRLRDGTMGLFPANYVEIVQKGPPPAQGPPSTALV